MVTFFAYGNLERFIDKLPWLKPFESVITNSGYGLQNISAMGHINNVILKL